MEDSNVQRDLLGFAITREKKEDDGYGLTKSQQEAFDLMTQGKNLYICGPAGTGKSYLIECFVDYCSKKHKPLMVCAPTGMAARKIHGETCHSAFSLDVGPILNKKLGKPIKNLMESEILLIDEISMLRIDAFDAIIRKVEQANRIRKRDLETYLYDSDAERQKIIDSNWKLNPIQIILVGDFYQLPPVLVDKDRSVLESADAYNHPLGNGYAFQSDRWHSYSNGFITVRLTEVVRQQHDKAFTVALNKIRKGKMEGADYIVKNVSDHPLKDGIWLYGKRKDVEKENIRKVESLPGAARTYKLKRTGDFGDSELAVDTSLTLKVGARVMSLLNDPHGDRYVNGSLGTVEKLLNDLVTVRFDNGSVVNIERYKWSVYKYDVVDGKLSQTLRGTYEQFPLRLAYAITIHKSQGQTFDKVNISTKSFAPGQLYVGLSRVRSVENMYIEGDIDEKNLLVDKEVLRFDRHPHEYRFFDSRGGARKGAGRKPEKKGRGPTKPVRVPVRYKELISRCVQEIDRLAEQEITSVSPVLVPAEFADQIRSEIEKLKREKSKL